MILAMRYVIMEEMVINGQGLYLKEEGIKKAK
jgi:hypothetical protein